MKAASLPRSWQWATIDEIGAVISGGTPRTSDPTNFDGDIPWITPADLTGYTSKFVATGKRNISERGHRGSSAQLIPKRSILFSSRAPIGYVAIAENDLTTNQGFKSVSLYEGLDEKYVYYYLRSAKALAESKASGTTFKELSGSRFAKLPVPIAPLFEQRRIVERIESLFARIEKGEEALREIQKLIKRYRQSILKAAVTGELTRDWREANREKSKPAGELLGRILEKRRNNWQGRSKYKEPLTIGAKDLPALPSDWCWSSLDMLISSGPQNGIYVPKANYGSGTPIIRIDDYQIDWVRERGLLQSVKVNKNDADLYRLDVGDLVINRVNSISHLGKCLLVDDEHAGCLYESNMMRLSLSGEVDAKFIELYLSSFVGRARLIESCKHAVNQASINQADVKRTPIPLPSLSEQRVIVKRVNAALESAKSLGKICDAEFGHSGSLRQSILKSAFSGQLVPQDPNDEPAGELLARIRAEREAATKARPRKKPARKKSARRKAGAGS